MAGHRLLRSGVRCRQNGRTICHLHIIVFLSAYGRVTSGLQGKQLSEPPQMPRFWVSVIGECEGENCFDDQIFMRILVKSISMYVCLCTRTCEIYIWITCVKSLSFCNTCPDKYRLHTTK